MNSKYTNFDEWTGHKIYEDKSLEVINFYEDYSNLTCREIKNNLVSVYTLCSWIYYSDRAFPWFEPMIETAAKYSNFPMFVMVFYMWCFYYEERDNSYKYQEMERFIENSPDYDKKYQFIKEIYEIYGDLCSKNFELESFYSDHSSDEDNLDKYDRAFDKIIEHQFKKFLSDKLGELNVNLINFEIIFDECVKILDTEYQTTKNKV